MIPPELPANEEQRLEELRKYDLLDSAIEQDYNDLVRLASEICNTPISLISLIDRNRQWFKARVGLEAIETPRDVSFCAHAIHQDDIFIVPDATADARFFDNPLVMEDPKIRFYAGVPMKTGSGFNLGTLCVIDSFPRELSDSQKFSLKTLSRQVVHLFELRHSVKKLSQQKEILKQNKDKIDILLKEKSELLKLENARSSLKSKFISILAHDLRNPLFQLQGLVDLLKDDDLTREEIVTLSHQIRTGIDTTSELLFNLLQWASSALEGSQAKMIKISIAEQVESVKNQFQIQFDLKKNKFHSNIGTDVFCLGTQDKINLILRNLIANANKFTENGNITVSSRKKDDFYAISVKDDGVGMKKETLEKLLQGEKVDSTAGTKKEKGTGIGLILTKDFVESLGGQITVTSTLNEGTVFTFTLPVYKELV